jgi:uncharacterized lipoprotein YddW (UPF0748 family)
VTHHLILIALLAVASCQRKSRSEKGPGPTTPPSREQTDDKPSNGQAGKKIQLGHSREMRGVWVASVLNINWPSARGLSVAAQQTELRALLDTCRDTGANAVFLQVRPESDALYSSQLEPWSTWISGTQGRAPSPLYDPLEFAVTEAHRRGLELHAWMNPFRGRYYSSSAVAESHISKRLAQYARPYGTATIMDPGAQAVQEHIIAVFRDVAGRYDIDGIHIDDYFYPYPEAGATFNDDALYTNYRATGGQLAKGDWRRDNVNQFMRRSAEAIRSVKPHLSFGASPFGIYRPGTPPGTEGALDQYEQTYTDPRRWMEEGWVDYVVPQLYWPTTHAKFGFAKLLDWWVSANPRQIPIFVGTNLSQLGASGWTLQEYAKQTAAVRERSGKMALGQLFYNVKNFALNRDGIRDQYRNDLYATPALPPIHGRWSGAAEFPGTATLTGGKLSWAIPSAKAWRGVVIYRNVSGTWKAHIRSGLADGSIDAAAGGWALTAVDAWAGESFAIILSN